MSIYAPIERADQLPPPGPIALERRETTWIDFKAAHQQGEKKGADRGSDMAAFANTFGGTILLGASEQSACLTYVPTIADENAARDIKEAYESDAASFCQPAPRIDVVPLLEPRTGYWVVAVNVDPSVELVAVRHKDDPHAWRFPFRVGSHAGFYTPHELAKIMDTQYRRALLLLNKHLDAALLGGEVSVNIHYMTRTGGDFGPTFRKHRAAMLTGISEGDRCISLKMGSGEAFVPIRSVTDVWVVQNEVALSIDGIILDDAQRPRFVATLSSRRPVRRRCKGVSSLRRGRLPRSIRKQHPTRHLGRAIF